MEDKGITLQLNITEDGTIQAVMLYQEPASALQQTPAAELDVEVTTTQSNNPVALYLSVAGEGIQAVIGVTKAEEVAELEEGPVAEAVAEAEAETPVEAVSTELTSGATEDPEEGRCDVMSVTLQLRQVADELCVTMVVEDNGRTVLLESSRGAALADIRSKSQEAKLSLEAGLKEVDAPPTAPAPELAVEAPMAQSERPGSAAEPAPPPCPPPAASRPISGLRPSSKAAAVPSSVPASSDGTVVITATPVPANADGTVVITATPVPAEQVKALPVRKYMDATVVPVLRKALRALNDLRPADPLMFLSEYLLEARQQNVSAHGKVHQEDSTDIPVGTSL